MPKSAKRNVKIGPAKPLATSTPAVAKPAPAVAGPSKTAERAVARDAKFLDASTYGTDGVSTLTAAYLSIFAQAAKRTAAGTFRVSDFVKKAAYQPETVYNYRTRAKLLAEPESTHDQPILRRVSENTFAFADAVTSKAAPDNAKPHILAARTVYANAKPLASF